MGKQIPTTQSFRLPDSREIVIETGKLATQAHGSAMVRSGKTMILATVCSDKEPREGQSFFPLSVDYQEKYAAAGRVPGNFFRREGKLSDYEVLISRLVDRAVRPLFPDGYMNETQIIITLISADNDDLPDALAALAASSALSVSDIPWAGPISEVRVARIGGKLQINPGRKALKDADIDIIVAATIADVMMVEGEAKQCSEKDLVEAIKYGHDVIKVQCEAQLNLAQKVGEKALTKRTLNIPEPDADLYAFITAFASEKILDAAKSSLDKQVRKDAFDAIKKTLEEELLQKHGEEFLVDHKADISAIYEKLKKSVIRKMVLDKQFRLDGRKLNEVRPIWTEVDYLPSAHGSAIFTRGETQSLTSVTLGTKKDEMLVDNALEMRDENFILHYNFPSFSVGEVKPNRGPGRREIGHAFLAGRSLRQVMPKDLPYTIRIVSDILESNGSSSMATVCAGSLALMDAGIQIPEHVAGIAMGLISEQGRTAILSDILGDEDALGDMDFKVTGTAKGIVGCQMDIKIDGMPYELLENALNQAREGRLHILGKLNEGLAKARVDLKPHAPRVDMLSIDKSFIGAVIGPGGKIIQEIQEVTGTTINIDEVDGRGIVHIYGNDQDSVKRARARIDTITHMPEVGNIYDGRVASLMPYGVFVDFMGRSGLLHISEVSHSRIDKIEDVFAEGDMIKVKLVEIDKRTGKYRLSRKALMPKPQHSKSESNEESNQG